VVIGVFFVIREQTFHLRPGSGPRPGTCLLPCRHCLPSRVQLRPPRIQILRLTPPSPVVLSDGVLLILAVIGYGLHLLLAVPDDGLLFLLTVRRRGARATQRVSSIPLMPPSRWLPPLLSVSNGKERFLMVRGMNGAGRLEILSTDAGVLLSGD
jgi:hypothetical protein